MRWLTIAACALPGGLILLLLARWWYLERQRQQFDALSWPQQIETWKTDTPMALPPIKPLRANTHGSQGRLVRYRSRMEQERGAS